MTRERERERDTRHLFGVGGLLLSEQLLGGPELLPELPAFGFFVAELVLQLLQLLLDGSAGSGERDVRTLLRRLLSLKKNNKKKIREAEAVWRS